MCKRTWLRMYKSYLTRCAPGMGGEMILPGEKEYMYGTCQHDYEIADAVRDFPDPRRCRVHLNVITWNWHGLWSFPIYRLTLTRAIRFTIEKWERKMRSINVYLPYSPSKYYLLANKFLAKLYLILSKHIVIVLQKNSNF